MKDKKMRDLLNVLTEGTLSEPIGSDTNPGMGINDPAINAEPTSDIASNGVETTIEVRMGDDDAVEVEIYAKQGDELGRLMDLAGVFHKGKQGPGIVTDLSGMDSMGLDPQAPVELEIPVDAMELGDMDPMDDIEAVDVLDDEVDESAVEHDYGYPDPNMGQQRYELKAFDHSGGASKPVRQVPARSGDNPMMDMSDKKSLCSYMEDVESKNNNDIVEADMDTVAQVQQVKSQNIIQTPQQQSDEQRKIKDLERSGKLDKMDASDISHELTPDNATGPQLRDLDSKDYEDGIDDIEERAYSFKSGVLPFQGLSGVQRVKRGAMNTVKNRIRKR